MHIYSTSRNLLHSSKRSHWAKYIVLYVLGYIRLYSPEYSTLQCTGNCKGLSILCQIGISRGTRCITGNRSVNCTVMSDLLKVIFSLRDQNLA